MGDSVIWAVQLNEQCDFPYFDCILVANSKVSKSFVKSKELFPNDNRTVSKYY